MSKDMQNLAEQADIKEITELLKSFSFIHSLLLFGSRTKGKTGRDTDICVFPTRDLTMNERLSIDSAMPDGVDISNLVADFEVGGVYVDVNGLMQVSGLTPNNFLEPVSYHLEGSNIKDWIVYVETVSGIKQYLFNRIKIGPNPSNGEIRIDNISGFNVRLLDSVGKTYGVYKSVNNKTLVINNLNPGIYFVQLEKDGIKEVRKLIVQ